MDEYEAVIADLKAQRNEIDAVIAILRRQARKTTGETRPAPEPPPRVAIPPAAPSPEEGDENQEPLPAAAAMGRPGLAARTKRGPGRPPIPRS
jgi:hypothetical protein